MIVYRELSSIEKDLGFSAKTLYGLSNNIAKHYHPVPLPKKDGGVRQLLVPDEALKAVQRAIVDVLLPLEPVSRYATAYKPASNLVYNALPHVNKAQILKLDIRGFFDSIRYILVKDKAFPKERYSESIRILLSMLCYYKEVLPQGAPTSPSISNIILFDFDNEVGAFCEERNIDYTRYCDDMTFSGNNICEKELIDFVAKKLKENGFLLNWNKTKLFKNSNRQSVTGIVVNKKLNIQSSYKREIRQSIYYIKKFGLDSHLSKINYIGESTKYLNSLLGKVNFVLQVSVDNREFIEYKDYLSRLITTLNK